MLNIIKDTIKDTHGDILGIILFIMLIIYFIGLEHMSNYELGLLSGCCFGLIVDTCVCVNYIICKINENKKI